MTSVYYIFETANIEEDYGLRSLDGIKFSLEEVCDYSPLPFFDCEVWQVFNQDSDAQTPIKPRLAARWHGSLGWQFQEEFHSELCVERYTKAAIEAESQALAAGQESQAPQPAEPVEEPPPVDPRYRRGHVMHEINEAKRLSRARPDAYQDHVHGRMSHERWMLHRVFEQELANGGLLEGEDAEPLEWEFGESSIALQEYFADIANHSDHPEYLPPYTAEDFLYHRLFKVKGLDAGFALRWGHPVGWDVVYVHNNSGQLGLGRQLLVHAIASGGNMLRHFDGYLSSVYAKHFPKIHNIDSWDERYAPVEWKYKPIKMEDSIWAERHRQMGDYPDEKLKRARENYAQGKPHTVYRRTNASVSWVKGG
jgi:hypothetical protein